MLLLPPLLLPLLPLLLLLLLRLPLLLLLPPLLLLLLLHEPLAATQTGRQPKALENAQNLAFNFCLLRRPPLRNRRACL